MSKPVSKYLIAACGLNCKNCDIYLASENPDIARSIANWFKKEKDIDVKLEDIYCSSCKGDRAKHWSPDCWILECCVDKKGLEFCSKCEEFPYDKLINWANTSPKYKEALERLKKLI